MIDRRVVTAPELALTAHHIARLRARHGYAGGTGRAGGAGGAPETGGELPGQCFGQFIPNRALGKERDRYPVVFDGAVFGGGQHRAGSKFNGGRAGSGGAGGKMGGGGGLWYYPREMFCR